MCVHIYVHMNKYIRKLYLFVHIETVHEKLTIGHIRPTEQQN